MFFVYWRSCAAFVECCWRFFVYLLESPKSTMWGLIGIPCCHELKWLWMVPVHLHVFFKSVCWMWCICACVCVYMCVCVCVCLCVPMHACTPLTTCMNPMSFVSYCLFEWFFTAEFLFNCVIVEYAVYSMYSSMRFCLICLCFVCTCLYCLSCSCCNCSWTGKKLNDIHCESGSCCLRGPYTGVKILICSVDVAELSSSPYPCYGVRSGNDGRFCRRCGRAVLFCTPMLWC